MLFSLRLTSFRILRPLKPYAKLQEQELKLCDAEQKQNDAKLKQSDEKLNDEMSEIKM